MDFTQYTFGTYKADPVHGLIGEYLDRVVGGEVDRLMIFAPPQHGKSELVSVRLPAFWLGRRPDDPVILSSYGAALAERKSRAARDVVESAEYARLFESRTRQDSRAVQYWSLAGRRGSMLAVGVGGPVTGQGALLGIIDDPFENWEQAQSQTYRDRVWEWWQGTFRTRIWEDGAVVLIMTRWHEDDLAGRLLQDQPGRWQVLRLPALAESQAERDENNRHMGLAQGEADPLGREPGEALSPARFSREALLATKTDVGSLVWNAEYQGAPRAIEGTLFQRSWFRVVDALASVAYRVRYWDKAATQGGGAYTSGVRIGIDQQGWVTVEDVQRGQWSTQERRAVMLQTAQADAALFGNQVVVCIEQEPGSSGVDSVQDEIRLLAGFPIYADRPSGNKDVRLLPFQAQAEAGNVRMLRAAWNRPYLDELAAIPNGRYRDQGDASSGAYNRCVELMHAIPDGSVVVYDEDVRISPY
ncbi:MAG TPA: terminase family protein [Caldilineaceae bacterium]|nr:terminase family protein [Caldilineaceae bacterium]